MRKAWTKRLMALVLVIAMVAAYALPAGAVDTDDTIEFTQVDNNAVSAARPGKTVDASEEAASYNKDDVVRVSIVLEKAGTIAAGFRTKGIASNTAAMAYRNSLKAAQQAMEKKISASALNGAKLDVVWNLTLVANIISANVPFGAIEKIKAVDGVSDVVIETRYEPCVTEKNETADPNMSTSSVQIGSNVAYAAGYTGAGSRIAIIDTGTDDDHELFQEAPYLYALEKNAEAAGMDVEAYKASLNLMTVEEIASKLDQLNMASSFAKTGAKVEDLYLSAKLPFAFNYVDEDLQINHDNDSQGEHGSHVAGIATANRYVEKDGEMQLSLDAVLTQGVAPDAQLITMKVFGKGGGAYDADYMVAIEDAVILGCDSVNLSLGSGNPGLSHNSTAAYQAILDSLVDSDTVVSMSAGNSGHWAENSYTMAGGLYGDGVSYSMTGSPGSFTNSLSVASVDNDGFTGAYLTVGESAIFYTESSGYSNPPISATIPGEREFILFQNTGVDGEDKDLLAPYADLIKGKIAICSRGASSFYQKMDAAAAAGAIGCIVVNNQPGTINMDLSSATSKIPCISVTLADGEILVANAEENTAADGTVYYTGKLTVGDSTGSVAYGSEYYTMSDFSSWGVPGSLEMKPEITAPGGNIYSVNGAIAGGTSYESMSGTSMASPQVAGMAALVAQYIRENGLAEKTGLTVRALSNSLLMGTAVPIREEASEGNFYSVLNQGSGVANVGAAVSAEAYILMDEDANAGALDGKVKVELGDDPDRTGVYSFGFSINNLTDEAIDYDLSCDTFTQDIYAYYVNENEDVDLYLDTWTAPIDADISWVVDGETVRFEADNANYDLNMDGLVDQDDVQALLDWLAGADIEIDEFAADIDNDDELTTRDARALLLRLTTGHITVPANGSVKVDATIELKNYEKDFIDVYYGAGAYVEAYVFVTPVETEDGADRVTMSIPVLGYYGSWTDGSMYDIGTAIEYMTGAEVRNPYLGDPSINALGIVYADDPSSMYYFGGNPIDADKEYHPERASVNTERGDMMGTWTAALIRNSSGGRYTVKDTATGEILTEKALGAANGAYYYTNGQTWQQTKKSYSLNLKVPEAAEGTELAFELTHAPEYYVQEDGSVDFDALGAGASMTFKAVADNTAPVLDDVVLSLKNNALRVTATDNRYVAGAMLFNSTGKKLLSYAVVDEAEKGEAVTLDLSLDGVTGDKFLLQVADYAMNVTTFEVSMGLGGGADELPDFIAYDCDNGYWTAFDVNSKYSDLEPYEESSVAVLSGTIVDHYAFFECEDGVLYVAPETDLSDPIPVAELGIAVSDMAYSEYYDVIFGVCENYLIFIDKLTGEWKVLGEIGVETNTLAVDAEGTFYCNNLGTADIYTFTVKTLAEPTKVATAGNRMAMQYLQAMEIDPNTGDLVWTSYYVNKYGYAYLFTMDTETYKVTKHNDLWYELSALLIPAKSGSGWDAPTTEVTGLTLAAEAVDILVGGSTSVLAIVQPWTVTDHSVTWTSDDETIATVSADGVITGVAEGSTVVTAASVLDPNFTAEVTVNVSTIKATVRGALQDEEGTPMFYEWDLSGKEGWVGGAELSTSIESATKNVLTGDVYVCDASEDAWSIHLIDGETGETKETYANSTGVPLWDMAFSTEFATEEAPMIHGVYYYYLFAGKDPSNLDTKVFGLSSYLSQYTGATELVAVASGGYEEVYDEDDDTYVDTEAIYMLDDTGAMWLFNVYPTEEGMGAYLNLADTDIGNYEAFGGYGNNDMYNSMVMDQQGNFFVSVFDEGKNTNSLYMLTGDMENGFTTTYVGNVGDGVWPATILEVENHDVVDTDAVVRTVSSSKKIDAVTVTAEELAAAKANINVAAKAAHVDNSTKTVSVESAVTGSLNAVTGSVEKKTINKMDVRGVEAAKNAKVVSVELTLDQAAGNGLYYMEFDNEAVEFLSVETDVQMYGLCVEEDWLAFSFASEEEYEEGTTVAVVNFAVVAPVETADIYVAVLEEADDDYVSDAELNVDVCATADFTDVDREAWYHEAADFVAFNGIIEGTTPTTFSPEGNLTRAQMVTMLYRMAGEPEFEAVENVFTDVKEKHWHYNYVMWAVSTGLTNGTSADKFSPNKAMTRSEMVTFLARFFKADVESAEFDLSVFEDASTVKNYAVQNLKWALANGLLHCDSKTALKPNAPATRAEAAFAIMGLCADAE